MNIPENPDPTMLAEYAMVASSSSLEKDSHLLNEVLMLINYTDPTHFSERQKIYELIKGISAIAEQTASVFAGLCAYHGNPIQEH